MRYILIILVFLSVGTNAQMVIKAHPNYIPLGAGNLLLDQYPNAEIAYSLRKLDKDYSGSAIRVRKDTTGQPEQDIGFTASGDLDTAALKSFLNARSGFVTTWYDQAGIGNAVQTTSANQPRIALNGVIDRKNGKPMINFDGINDRLAISSTTSSFNYLHNGTKSFVCFVSHINTSGVEYAFLENVNANPANVGTYVAAFGTFRFAHQTLRGVSPTYSVNNLSGNNVISTNQFIATINIDADDATAANRSEVYINGGAAIKNNTLTNSVSNANAAGNLTFGSSANGTFGFLNGGFQEIIIYRTDQSNSRTGIRDNINTHYGIY